MARDLGKTSAEDLVVAVGMGNISANMVAQKVAAVLLHQKASDSNQPEELPDGAIDISAPKLIAKNNDLDVNVEGISGVQVLLADCCKPVPGDPIVGYLTQMRGITAHRSDCGNIANAHMNRIVPVAWNPIHGKLYLTCLKIEAVSRGGLIQDVSRIIDQSGGSTHGMRAKSVGNTFYRMTVDLYVRNLEHLYEIIGKINGLGDIMEVRRN
jgi:GTP pyrophosphokinase